MLTLAWVLVFLAGIAATFLLASLVALLRFLLGRSRRRDAHPVPREGGFNPFGWLARLIFYALTVTLILAGAVHAFARGGATLAGCGVLGAGVDCNGWPGAGLVSAWLSLPASLGDATNLALVVLRDLPTHAATGFANLPIPPLQVAFGLVGPLVLLFAWIGFWLLLADIGRAWSRADVVEFVD